MKQEKGFTLIELLAVIVILAVIALIATPLIMGTIEKAKVNAYKDTIYGIVKAAENYIAEELLKEDYQGETLDLSSETKLKYKGTKPTKGSMTLLPSGSISLAIQNGKYCYTKKSNSDIVEVATNAKECTIRVARNLVKNGYGEYGDNTNFEDFTYQNGIFYISFDKQNQRMYSSEYIPIDPNKSYRISVTMKTSDPKALFYVGMAEYDIDKKHIDAFPVKYIGNTLTTLKKDLKDGDTVVYLDNISNWLLDEYEAGTPANGINRGFIFWNYKDSTGYLYPAETYSRNAWRKLYEMAHVNKVNHTITLNEPWNHGTIKAGTEVSQSMDGNTFNYGILKQKASLEFQTYTNIVKGTQLYNGEFKTSFDDTKFRPGTKYIRFLIIPNHEKLPNVSTEIKDIVIEEVKS